MTVMLPAWLAAAVRGVARVAHRIAVIDGRLSRPLAASILLAAADLGAWLVWRVV